MSIRPSANVDQSLLMASIAINLVETVEKAHHGAPYDSTVHHREGYHGCSQQGLRSSRGGWHDRAWYGRSAQETRFAHFRLRRVGSAQFGYRHRAIARG